MPREDGILENLDDDEVDREELWICKPCSQLYEQVSVMVKKITSFQNDITMQLAVRSNISHHCARQSGYIMTAILDGKYHLFTNYLISIQFDGAI